MPRFAVDICETTRWYGVIEAKDREEALKLIHDELDNNGAGAFNQDAMSEGYNVESLVETDAPVDVVLETE